MINLLKLSDAPWQIDLLAGFACLILAMLPISIILVRLDFKRTHKLIQNGLSTVLLPTFIAFEYQVRTTGWREIAEESPYYDSVIIPVLPLHMLFASCCLFAWFYTLLEMLKKESDTSYRQNHRKLGYLSASLMYLTALSGLGIYYLGFFN